MPVPASINDLSTTAGNNSPAGSESPATTDDYLRAHAAFIAALRDENASQATAITAAQSTANSKQPADATLTALAGVVTAANKLIYATDLDSFGTTDLSAFARTLLADANASAARATLDVYSKAEANGIAIGVGQTWRDVTGSRAKSVTYTNTTEKPILVHVQKNTGQNTLTLTVDSLEVSRFYGYGIEAQAAVTAIVPRGSTYIVGGTGSIFYWVELR